MKLSKNAIAFYVDLALNLLNETKAQTSIDNSMIVYKALERGDPHPYPGDSRYKQMEFLINEFFASIDDKNLPFNNIDDFYKSLDKKFTLSKLALFPQNLFVAALASISSAPFINDDNKNIICDDAKIVDNAKQFADKFAENYFKHLTNVFKTWAVELALNLYNNTPIKTSLSNAAYVFKTIFEYKKDHPYPNNPNYQKMCEIVLTLSDMYSKTDENNDVKFYENAAIEILNKYDQKLFDSAIISFLFLIKDTQHNSDPENVFIDVKKIQCNFYLQQGAKNLAYETLLREALLANQNKLAGHLLCGDFTNGELKITPEFIMQLKNEGCPYERHVMNLCYLNSKLSTVMLKNFLNKKYTSGESIDLNKQVDKNSFVMAAIESDNIGATELLIKAGASLAPVYDVEPLDYALKLKRFKIASIITSKLLENKQISFAPLYKNSLLKHSKPITKTNIKKEIIDIYNYNRLLLGVNVKTVETYQDLKLPSMPIAFPYQVIEDGEIPKVFIAGSFKKTEVDDTLPSGIKDLLKDYSIDITTVDFFISFQNKPWDPTQDKNKMELKFHPWLHSDAPFYLQQEYNQTDFVFWSAVSSNNPFSKLITTKKEVDDQLTVSTHGPGLIVYSPDNMKLESCGITVDPKVSQSFFSLGICQYKNRAVVTFHVLLSDKDADKLNKYIDDLSNNDLKNIGFDTLVKLLEDLGVDSHQGIKFLSNIDDEKLSNEEIEGTLHEFNKSILKNNII